MFHLLRFPSWKSSDPKIVGIKTYTFSKISVRKKAPENSRWPFYDFLPWMIPYGRNYTIFEVLENPRRGRQARNFRANVPKIRDLKSSSGQIFFKNWRWVPMSFYFLKEKSLCLVTSYKTKDFSFTFYIQFILLAGK